MSVLSDIANAVVAQLNAATFSQTVTAVFRYSPDYDKVSDGLSVQVFGLTQTLGLITRSDYQNIFGINVAITSPVTNDDASVAAMDLFREEVLAVLAQNRRLTTYSGASLVEVANEVVYDPARLEKELTYLSIMSLKYTTI